MLTSLYITINKKEELFPSNLMLHTGIYWHAVTVPLKSGHSRRSFFKTSHKSSDEIHLFRSLRPA